MNTITAIQKTTELHNGVKMPWLGLGTYLSEPGEVEDAVKTALQVGYRSIDTAAFYRNELNIGKAIKESDVNRDEIFLTSKVWNSDQGYDKTLQAFDKSLEQLGTEYLDLYLVHWPVKGKFLDTWKALEKLYEEKRVRAIGVSNFLVHHLEELMGKAKIIPMVNQVEFHPYLVQKDLMLFCLENNIQQEAWSPIMKGRADEVELLRKLAEKYKEKPEVCNAIGSHHDETEMTTLIAPIVQVCDAISGARPGARREVVESYIKRLKELEAMALSYPGVLKTYAIQAGRDLRIMVDSGDVTDSAATLMSRDIAKRIESELTYPGQIRVTVIRETRAVEYAK